MSIVTYLDFIGEETVAGVSNAGTRQNLEGFITEYEPQFLEALLGGVLSNEFLTGLILVPVEPATNPVSYNPIEERWLTLRDIPGLKKMIVCYVYYWYIQNETTLTTATGETKPANENSIAASSWDKQVKAWNKMATLVRKFTLSTDVYPAYVPVQWSIYDYYFHGCCINEIFYFKNTFGL